MDVNDRAAACAVRYPIPTWSSKYKNQTFYQIKSNTRCSRVPTARLNPQRQHVEILVGKLRRAVDQPPQRDRLTHRVALDTPREAARDDGMRLGKDGGSAHA